MERLKEIKEKGIDTVTSEDIPIGLGVITEFMNENPDAQSLIKGIDMTAVFDLEGADNYVLSIANGKSEYSKKSVSDASFTLFTSLKTITEIIIGEIDAAVAVLKGDVDVQGDFEKMVIFFEIIELAYEALDLVDTSKREVLIDAKTMKKLYDVYMAGATDIDPNDIPLIFNIFTTFANLNAEAQEVIEEEEMHVQMLIEDVGAYVVNIVDNVSSWSDVQIDNPSLQFKIALDTAANVFLNGDAAQAFLAGKIEAEGNIAEALILQDLINVFLDLLPFVEQDDD